ncbi:glucuronide transporter [Clostridioides difficile]|uniref:hypothetical protein n=1 Tax=Clostridioides difficile TaxID=1496 RepID=UPI00102538EB|nr:hypothetical protein [Clostridioides difficile]VFC59541.1 glucuronide transporter [Clostridioides difficile]VHX80816.1 glucuronide transporter [Clostridioides difficile]VIF82699.1 glucuronide transporter [Clostridioides difficile]HBE9443814.1 hypothetical protein [Clostridioides difficile]
MTGYVANISQTSQALCGIRSINGIITIVLTVAMLVLIKMYSLAERKCREVINELRSK